MTNDGHDLLPMTPLIDNEGEQKNWCDCIAVAGPAFTDIRLLCLHGTSHSLRMYVHTTAINAFFWRAFGPY